MALKLDQKKVDFNVMWAGLPSDNCFGFLPKRKEIVCSDWYSCRESFSSLSMQRMLFCTKTKDRTIKFVHFFESKLKLEKTKFYSTSKANVLYIEPNNFWTQKLFYKSLFTAILKASKNYVGNFEAAVNKYRYFKITKYALDRFLKGYSQYTGRSEMWFDSFSAWSHAHQKDVAISEDFINKLLVRP